MIDQDFKKEISQPCAGENGFSMIEMLIAIVVITVGLVSIAGMSVYVSRANSVSNNLNVLAAAAQDQVDRLRTATWSAANENPMISVGGTVVLPGDSIVSESAPVVGGGGDGTPAQPLTATTTGQGYSYTLDPANPHHALASNTASGTLDITWQVRQGPTADMRYVTIVVVQQNPAPHMSDGFMVSTIITRN